MLAFLDFLQRLVDAFTRAGADEVSFEGFCSIDVFQVEVDHHVFFRNTHPMELMGLNV